MSVNALSVGPDHFKIRPAGYHARRSAFANATAVTDFPGPIILRFGVELRNCPRATTACSRNMCGIKDARQRSRT
jgi:hypothetical protein